jgi:hypothetical protein
MLSEELLKSTAQLKNHSVYCDHNKIVSETDNRERLINILDYLQLKIEREINLIDVAELKRNELEKIKSWNQKFQEIVNHVRNEDLKILELLNQDKNEISRKIAEIFKSREKFRGYNLDNVKV